ncbi:MAG: Hsp20/alpha crystallin family protein [Leptospiraceae bacterium]|nr:Hsp20/alpha crystallin family protein [Leptospiraceae bacterium]
MENNQIQSNVVEREQTTKRPVFIPKVDIHSDNQNIYLTAGMPGIDNDSIDISIEENVLTVSGKLKEGTQPKDAELKYAEYRVGDYSRSFTINEDIDSEAIDATYKLGVLSIKLPRRKPVTKKIEVKVA